MPKIGLQLYTVGGSMEKDFEGTLKKVAEYGYEGVEFAGYGGRPAGEITALLKEFGLTAGGTHIGFGELSKNWDFHLAFAKDLGLSSVTIAAMSTDEIADPKSYPRIAEMAADAEKAGMRLAYHNHSHEFVRRNGAYLFDTLFDTAPALYAEIDTYWAAHGGEEPIALMERMGKRMDAIHIKDMATDPEKKKQHINPNIGEGCMDIRGILRKADALGIEWAFVEMDKPDGDPLTCVKKSRENLKKLGY